jgi:phage-related protein
LHTERCDYEGTILLQNYYLDFFKTLNPEVRKKFNWTLQLISEFDRVPKKYFSHITESLDYLKSELKLDPIFIGYFSFFDEGNLIILVNGFQKKTQKTPKNEIQLAEELKKQYFDEKEK